MPPPFAEALTFKVAFPVEKSSSTSFLAVKSPKDYIGAGDKD